MSPTSWELIPHQYISSYLFPNHLRYHSKPVHLQLPLSLTSWDTTPNQYIYISPFPPPPEISLQTSTSPVTLFPHLLRSLLNLWLSLLISVFHKTPPIYFTLLDPQMTLCGLQDIKIQNVFSLSLHLPHLSLFFLFHLEVTLDDRTRKSKMQFSLSLSLFRLVNALWTHRLHSRWHPNLPPDYGKKAVSTLWTPRLQSRRHPNLPPDSGKKAVRRGAGGQCNRWRVLPMAFFITSWFSCHIVPNVPHRACPEGMGWVLIQPPQAYW